MKAVCLEAQLAYLQLAVIVAHELKVSSLAVTVGGMIF